MEILFIIKRMIHRTIVSRDSNQSQIVEDDIEIIDGDNEERLLEEVTEKIVRIICQIKEIH